MLAVSVNVMGQYNPTNPAEPGAPVRSYALTLEADPTGGGSFNLSTETTQPEGSVFWVQANVASNFTFVNWTEDGEVISTVARFQYTMPSRAAKLIAHYKYTPNGPAEPSEANLPPKPVYAPLYLTASPAAGCSFNIASGNNYEVGTSVSVRANVTSNFRFENWTQDGVVVSTSNPFNYVMQNGEQANNLVANFTYAPGNPVEPTQRLYHKVFLQCDPDGSGGFNVASGNEYEEGTQQTIRANANQWYTFVNWTLDGEVVSTSSTYTFTIPNKDISLVAHYTYNYNPNSPNEPSSSATAQMNLYGMTQDGMPGQMINYPVYLENTSVMPGVTVVVNFPEGFTVQADNTALSERTTGKELTVTPLGGNSYRFDITGGTNIAGDNGKIFDVPVVIAADVETGKSYDVTLTNGALVNADGSKVMIDTRNGCIYVGQEREDGLYASFTYDKLQNRFKFNNQSSAKAIEWTWNFGDGTSSTERNPMHIYAEPGYYDVTLTVKGETGTDVAMMSVAINDKATWRVEGTLFLDSEQKGVRYFTTAESLLDFMTASSIVGDVKVLEEAGKSFGCALSEKNITKLTNLQKRLAEGGYMLTLQKNGDGGTPVLGFGNPGESINADVVNLFVALGKNLTIDNVDLQLWGIHFDPTKIDALKSQTIKSGDATAVVDLSTVSTGLTFAWSVEEASESISGHTVSGTGNIPEMTLVNSSAGNAQITYNIVCTKDGAMFYAFTHTINVEPKLVGTFSNMKPATGTVMDATTVTLSWDGMEHAVYDVYLWNAANQRPSTPMITGITETTYTTSNFCQNHKSYKWQVVARNASQQIESDELSFSVKLLPNLHVTALENVTFLEAGTTVTINWTVRNDGPGDTEGQKWTDYLWLVPDVYAGTGQTTCKLLATKANVTDLAAGEEYVGTAEVALDEEQYGSYYLMVASDMNTVTQIEWDKVGGSIVNPYEPVAYPSGNEYAYLFAATAAAGNKVVEYGETSTHSDNFFYKKVDIAMPSMCDEDWNLLKDAYQQMGNGEGWTKTWDFDVERHTVETLPGVSMRGGRIVGINLSNNGLTGEFPFSLLALPKLESLNVSENSLTGDMGTGMQQFMEEHPDFESQLKAVNLAENQLSGNLGQFALPLANLVTIYASNNAIADVDPVINENVTTLTLGNQTIDQTVIMDVYERDPVAIWAQIPTVLLYDHEGQGYADRIQLLCMDAETGWSITIECQEDMVTIPKIFEGPVGKVMDALVVDDEGTPTGNTLKVQFQRPDLILGDVNGDGNITMADANAVVNYFLALDKSGITNFNEKAADVNGDDGITMADANAIVNMFLGGQ